MKVKVKIYGTLGRCVPEYRDGQEMEVEIPENGTVKELLSVLKIPQTMGAVVSSGGRILKPDDVMQADSPVAVFQPIHGG